MGFHQGRQAQLLCLRHVLAKRPIIEDRTDKKYRRSSKHLCLIDHIGIHRKVLAQDRNRYRRRNFLQIAVASKKTVRFCQYRDCAGACRLVIACDIQIRELRHDETFGRRCFFHLTDKRESGRTKCLLKRKCPAHGQFFCHPAHLGCRNLRFFFRDTSSRQRCQFF